MTTTLSPDTLKRLADAGLDPGRLPSTSPSSWTATAAGPSSAAWSASRGICAACRASARTIEECCRLGIGQLTLYCLSTENWKRPQAELDFLMTLLRKYLIAEREEIMEQNIRFTVIGKREGLSAEVLEEMDENIRVSRRQHRHGPVPGHQLQRPFGDGRDDARTGPAGSKTAPWTPTTSTKRRSATPCSRPACPIPTCSSAPPARCASAISCSGRFPTPSCG